MCRIIIESAPGFQLSVFGFSPPIDSWPMFPVQEAMRHDLAAVSFLTIAALTAFLLNPMTGRAQEKLPYERIASLAHGSPMVTVSEGHFFMGTAKAGQDPFSLDLPYDDTEQPQRHVWLDRFEIDRDEVSLGAFLLWLQQQQRPISSELRKLIDHMTTVHAVPPETLAQWPALYVTWTEASAFCRAQGKRLPTEAEWEKAARGDQGNLFPWGQRPPAPGVAMFGQYHVHEIPIVASVDSGEKGQSPYGLRHMAGNAAEWVADWFGIDYYATMPDRNPRGVAQGRYKVVRGGSWKSAPMLLRTATRSGASPEQRAATIGFRCARSIR
jgi:iron(II)-dependent oxidoreductase